MAECIVNLESAGSVLYFWPAVHTLKAELSITTVECEQDTHLAISLFHAFVPFAHRMIQNRRTHCRVTFSQLDRIELPLVATAGGRR